MMNKPLLSNLAMLGGVLLIVAGVVVALVTGMDILYGALGLMACAAGVGLILWGRGGSPDSGVLTQGPERSTQKPLSPSASSKFDRKI